MYTPVYVVSKTIRVSEEFHRVIAAHKREDETMEETLRRLIGGPDPDDVAGILSKESADTMRAAIDRTSDRAKESSRGTAERFD